MNEVYKYDSFNGFEAIDYCDFYDEIEDDDYYVMYLTKDAFKRFAERKNISEEVTNVALGKNYIIIEDDFTFASIDIINVGNGLQNKDVIGFYIENNRFIIIDIYDSDSSTNRAFHSLITRGLETNTPGRFINYFLNKLIISHNEVYDNLRKDVERIDDVVLGNDFNEGCINEITYLSHKTLKLYTNYERLLDFTEVLIKNENKILDTDDEMHIQSFARRVDRYSSNISYLSEYISHVKESYQAQLDIRLNRSMKIFTIVATIFSPLSFIVGWYGMNFQNMPELSWAYGYPFVVVLCMFVTVVCILWLKKLDK